MSHAMRWGDCFCEDGLFAIEQETVYDPGVSATERSLERGG